MKNVGLIFIICLASVAEQNLANARSQKFLEIAFRDISCELSRSAYDVTILSEDKDKINFDFCGEKLPRNIITRRKVTKAARLSSFGILLFESVEEFKKFYREKFLAENPKGFAGPFLLYVQISTATIKDLLRSEFQGLHLIEFIYFVVENETSIELLTAIWYSKRACNEFQLVVVNTFSKTTKQWTSNKFQIRKFDNFHGCRLRIDGGKIMYNYDRTMTISSDLQIKIIRDLSRRLNYSVVIGNDKASRFDFQISSLVTIQSIRRNDNLSISQPFIFRDSLLAIPVGEEYTAYEKLLLPFDHAVWFWILLVFFAAFFSIFLMKFIGQKARNFVIGSNIRAPALNVAMIFSGASQVKMPGKNFARFLVMAFVLYSLIIRTAWQGKMFEFMQQEIRKPEVQSISEMTKKNFTFHINLSFYFDLFDTSRSSRR